MSNLNLLELMELTRPRLERVFGDENALEIMGAVVNAIKQIARAADFPTDEYLAARARVREEMMSGDYEHLLAVARRYVKFANDEDG